MQRILMCPPFHYGVFYKINPLMQPETWQDNSLKHEDLAYWQWLTLFKALQHAGADILLQTPQAGVPDLVFTANAGLVFGKHAILSRFKFPQRAAEEPYNRALFSTLGLQLYKPQAVFEGEGDALWDPVARVLWLGYGQRSTVEVAFELQNLLQVEVVPLKLATDYFYHLDTAFSVLGNGRVLYTPQAFTPEALAVLQQRAGTRLLPVSDADAKVFACNALSFGTTVILPQCSAELQQSLTHSGLTVHSVDLSQYLMAGGAVKCLTLKLTNP